MLDSTMKVLAFAEQRSTFADWCERIVNFNKHTRGLDNALHAVRAAGFQLALADLERQLVHALLDRVCFDEIAFDMTSKVSYRSTLSAGVVLTRDEHRDICSMLPPIVREFYDIYDYANLAVDGDRYTTAEHTVATVLNHMCGRRYDGMALAHSLSRAIRYRTVSALREALVRATCLAPHHTAIVRASGVAAIGQALSGGYGALEEVPITQRFQNGYELRDGVMLFAHSASQKQSPVVPMRGDTIELERKEFPEHGITMRVEFHLSKLQGSGARIWERIRDMHTSYTPSTIFSCRQLLDLSESV